MNGPVTCDICGEWAGPREWLPCTLCARRFHFGTEEGVGARDCGVVVPNPQSENGC